MRRPIQIPTTGQLDKDSDLQYLNTQKGDMPDLYDMEFSAEDVMTLTTAKGNVEKIDFGSASLQNQKVRIYWESSPNPTNIVISLKNVNDQTLFTRSFNTDGGLIDFRAAIQSIFTGSIFSSTVTVYQNEPYVDVEVDLGYSDWSLEIRNGFGQYIFTVNPSNASVGDKYTNNGQVFTVVNSISGGTVLFCNGTGDPTPSGNLDRQTGTGTNPIIFSSFSIVEDIFSYAVIQEAVSATGVGDFIPIGSYDFLGDMFYWVTTQRNLKTRMSQSVANAVGNNFSRSVVTIPLHRLNDYETIAINGVVGCTGVNGIWVVKVIDSNRVELQGSLFGGAYISGGEIFKDLYGYGAIGVAKYDLTSETFQWIPLLRSKKLNFVTKREFYHPTVELNGSLISMYYTDDYNLPRATYYRGEYLPDGCIKAVNPLGQYAYETLENEIALQVNFSGYTLSFLEQIQSGGRLTAGNKRYAVRFITESLNASELSLLTNPIPVYTPQYTLVTNKIYGNPGNEETGKINRLQLTGITPGVFKFVELICFNYRGGELSTVAVDAIIVRRESLSQDQTEIVLEHNGNEVGVVNFDAALANQVQPDIVRAKDLTLIQNRLVLGSITTSPEYDLTEFCKTLKYSIKRFSVFGSFDSQTFYEFYNPEAVTNRVGYQQWEWYRFYIVGELFSGKLTQAFFAFDVRFISQADYALPEWNNEFDSTNITDRRNLTNDQFTDYDLTTANNEYLQYYLELNNINWDFQIDGVPIRQLFRSFKIHRAERVDEVLAAGAYHVAQAKNIAAPVKTYADNVFAFGRLWRLRVSPPLGSNYVIGNNAGPQGQGSITDLLSIDRRFGSFYSPDLLFNNTSYEQRINDKLIIFSSYQIAFRNNGEIQPGFNDNAAQAVITGFRSIDTATNAIFRDINKSVEAPTGSDATQITVGNLYQKKQLQFETSIAQKKNVQVFSPYDGKTQGSVVLALNSTFPITFGSNTAVDNGIYPSLIFRSKKDKYGSAIANNIVVYTQGSCDNGQTSVDVFGGDVFCQQTWLKHNFNYVEDFQTGSNISTTNYRYYLSGAGYNIISSNKVNTNLRVWNPNDNTQLIYGLSTRIFQAWIGSSFMDTIIQNSAYKIINQVQAQVVYDPEGQDTTQYLSRKWYSELKPNGSRVDFYRIFLPLSFQDNPAVQGSIFRVLNVNNELFTVQERGYTREYFNSRGQLVSPDQGQILIGDGSVLSRVGNNLTMFGSSNAGSVVIGKSQSGKDVVMFISAQFGQVLRFGDDGLVSVSLRERMRTFFNNNLKWAQEAKTPADGFGICGIWDNNNKQFIYTVKAWRQVDNWSVATTYNQGAIVQKGYDNQGVAKLWVLTATSSRGDLPGSSPVWQLIPTTDNNYYNVYTFTWSELKNAFTQFYSYLPNHYAEWNGTFLTSYPDLELPLPPIISRRSLTYQHGIGDPAEYYGIQFSGGKVSVVCNWQRDLNKKFFSLMLNGKGKPERVDITSLFRDENDDEIIKVSFLLASDFETRESYSYAPVKLELDANGSNDGDTGQVEGIWAKFAITYPVGKKSSLTTFVAYIRDSFRNFTR
jgi:hypothetical protein